MAILFEHHNSVIIQDAKALKTYLANVWEQRLRVRLSEIADDKPKDYQPFLRFDGNEIRARSYVGFIQQPGLHLELYPKVFAFQQLSEAHMLRHLFFWFDYCRRWKLPFSRSALTTFEDLDFPELIIYLMAERLLQVVGTRPISLYQEVTEALQTPKGRIAFAQYASQGIAAGRHHLVDCTYEPFLYNNLLNRTIKYTTRVLLGKTKTIESQTMLQELLFILEGVEDQPCTVSDLENIVLNPLFEEYQDVKDICRIVLEQQLYANEQYDLPQWSLLFPMDYVFEDFVAGFMERHLDPNWKVEYQKSELYLASTPKAFQMQHDIFLTHKHRRKSVIIDTKYKLREPKYKSDPKKGISQSDLYQVTTYALRRGVSTVLLLYPNLGDTIPTPDRFEIESGFGGKEKIKIIAAEIPFWTRGNLQDLPGTLAKSLQAILNTI